MEPDYLRDLRYKLQKRIRRLNAASPEYFPEELKRFWMFFDSIPTLRGITEKLQTQFPNVHGLVDGILGSSRIHHPGDTEEENAAISYGVLRRLPSKGNRYLQIGQITPGKFPNMLDELRALYLEPFYSYVDEHLDDWSFFVASLIRYKQNCEWFRREKLYRLWSAATRNGERLLAYDFYEYLHDKGVEFHIEPSSVSGEADAVSVHSSTDSFVAEVKVFNPEKGQGATYAKNGFRQAYRYTCDYNQSAGYLVIFNTSAKLIRFALSIASAPIPRIIFNHKTIFVIVIDIFPHEDSASRRSTPESVEITEAEILTALVLPSPIPLEEN